MTEYYTKLSPIDDEYKKTSIKTIMFLASKPNIMIIIWTKSCYQKWSQQILNDMFDSKFARTSIYTLHILDNIDQYNIVIDGAIVVSPEISSENEPNFLEYLSKFKSVIFISNGGEEFLSKDVEACKRATFSWRQSFKDNIYPEKTIFFPFGYCNQFLFISSKRVCPWEKKTRKWVFCGQVQNDNRQAMLQEMKNFENGEVFLTSGFGTGMDTYAYCKFLNTGKIIPCPLGNCSVDTFRMCEALECGSIPILEKTAPLHNTDNYWKKMFGDDHPFLVIDNWSQISTVLQPYINNELNLLKLGNKCWAWWIRYKRNLTYELLSQVQTVKNMVRIPNEQITDFINGQYIGKKENDRITDLVTVIVTTSIIPSHPITELLEKVYSAWKSYSDLRDCESIIVFDGCKLPNRELAYEKYKRAILELIKSKTLFSNTQVLFMDEHVHQANCIREAMKMVKTTNVMILEHDCILTGDIDIKGIMTVINKYPDIYKHILLYQEKNIYY